MRGATSVDGIISGFDTSAIITRLMSARQAALTQLQDRQTSLSAKAAAWQAINTSLLALKTLAVGLTTDSGLSPKTAISSNTSLLTASAVSSASPASADIVVHRLAQAHKISSAAHANLAQPLGLAGDILVNGHTISIAAADTLSSIRTKINNSGAGVIATFVAVSNTDYRLALTSANLGADAAIQLADANTADVLESLGFVTAATSIKHAVTNGAASDLFADSTTAIQSLLSLTSPPSGSFAVNGVSISADLAADSISDLAARINAQVAGVTATVQQETVGGVTRCKLQIVGDAGTPTFDDPDNILSTLGVLHKQIANQLQQAQDAQIELDGITITRPSNSITDVLAGVTLNLLNSDPATTVRVRVAPDGAAVQRSVANLISQFNSAMSLVNQQLSYDARTERSGVLFGEFPLVNLQERLRRAMTDRVAGLSGGYTVPAQLGIASSTNDSLSLNTDTFLSAYSSDPDAVAALLKTVGSTTDPDVTFVAAGQRTQPTVGAPYAVQVDALATRATKTGNDISAGLAQPETLTINGSYVVSLQAGWTTQQVVDAINNVMLANGVKVTATADGGAVTLTHATYGSRYAIRVSSTVGSGAPASTGLGAAVPGETATYSGTDVAGTINGEPATGSGQLLTGNAGNDRTDGLTLLVAGSSTGNRGTVSLTKGIASRLDDLLAFITKTGGLIDSRSQSLQQEIDYFDQRIAELQTRLAQEQERLYAKFTAMESALGALQRQSTWLSSQFDALTNLTQRRSR
jgi:flagellar hook-associated protein 2